MTTPNRHKYNQLRNDQLQKAARQYLEALPRGTWRHPACIAHHIAKQNPHLDLPYKPECGHLPTINNYWRELRCALRNNLSQFEESPYDMRGFRLRA